MMLTRCTARFVLAAGLLLFAGACERNKPEASKTAPSQTPAASEARPSDANADDLHAFLRKDHPGSVDTGLPPGHPPIDTGLPPGHPPIDDVHRPQTPAAGELPPGHPPIAGAATEAPAGRLQFDPPVDWKPEPVASTMRVAQYLIPRADGDTQDGQMIVFHFGPGQGGPTDMNIARWKGMFTTPDGQQVPDTEAKVEKFTVSGLPVTTLDVAGMYDDPMMIQSGGAPVKGEARMLAAIVEAPGGSYFFKAVGQKATISEHVENFDKLVQSVRME